MGALSARMGLMAARLPTKMPTDHATFAGFDLGFASAYIETLAQRLVPHLDRAVVRNGDGLRRRAALSCVLASAFERLSPLWSLAAPFRARRIGQLLSHHVWQWR